MPIVQLRSTSETQWLTAPLSPEPETATVAREWIARRMACELLVYPPNYLGNVAPPAWRDASSYLLNVDESGEQAEVVAMGVLPEQANLPEIIAQHRQASPNENSGLSAIASINEHHKSVVISSITKVALIIGGIIVHTNSEELKGLRILFPEAEV